MGRAISGNSKCAKFYVRRQTTVVDVKETDFCNHSIVWLNWQHLSLSSFASECMGKLI